MSSWNAYWSRRSVTISRVAVMGSGVSVRVALRRGVRREVSVNPESHYRN
jgi:hypothetical protein